MKYVLFLLGLFITTQFFGQAQVLPKLSELDSAEVKVKPGKGDGKNTTITYISYVRTPYGIDTIERKSPPLDSSQVLGTAKEAYDNILGYHRRAADATFNVWQQFQLQKGVGVNQTLLKKLTKERYEDLVWKDLGRSFVGTWHLFESDKEYTEFVVESDGTVKLNIAQPKTTKKVADPKFEILADVRVVVSDIVQGKPITFDFVGPGLFWNLQTGYLLQKVQ